MSDEKLKLMKEKYKLYARMIFMILMFFVGALTGVKAIDTINIEAIINTIWLFTGSFISTVIVLYYLEDE